MGLLRACVEYGRNNLSTSYTRRPWAGQGRRNFPSSVRLHLLIFINGEFNETNWTFSSSEFVSGTVAARRKVARASSRLGRAPAEALRRA
ncbi:hypothetical protein EVAR_60495_1 [Eumeta japonica]|uniref:Uncharacterized protein n=1 Tax=Eumeta variegata TaxID=151549 RepID=A0A4C1ZME3_EUMVA|nr:hypothetical protein EVAR_60495_1 [Eumeta japonica]